MRLLLLTLISILLLACSEPKQRTPTVILDTDIAPDFDDVGAMALLHALADNGEVQILATISCNAAETTAPTLSVFNTYYGRPEIPIGIVKAGFPDQKCPEGWAQYIMDKYPHDLKANAEAQEAVTLYRKILAGQPDHSVTIVTIGFFTNLAKLLDSPPDNYSQLKGSELVVQKVSKLVSMAARLDKDSTSGHEFNVYADAAAAKKVFAEWQTPWVISGFEIGVKIRTGANLVADSSIRRSPVQDAYRQALNAFHIQGGHYSWDQTAVLVAVRGWEPYYDVKKINFEIHDDGKNFLIPGEKITYLIEKMPPGEVGHVIEDLMMQPLKK